VYKKLFIPGPTHVRDEILQAQTAPMLGHREKEYAALQAAVTPKLQKLLYTAQRVYLYACSSTGMMEGSVRQASVKRVLNTACGAFSKRWHDMTKQNGIACDVLEVPLGQAVTTDLIDAALAKADYDAITLVMNETATGIMNPIQDNAAMIRAKYPDVLILVDAVSCMAGVKIEFDAWGLDVCLAGTQKCFALPPGLTVCAVSDRARERALKVPNRGHYFAYDQMDKRYDKNQTPATPAISLIQALNVQMDAMFAEGLDNRFARHLAMAEIVRAWARKYFAIYGDQHYLSHTVTNIENTRGFDFAKFKDEMGKRGAVVGGGYGDLKDKCFRIAHMGDLQVPDINWLIGQMNQVLGLA
jgi:aspartate aminotransferase-like enzyme